MHWPSHRLTAIPAPLLTVSRELHVRVPHRSARDKSRDEPIYTPSRKGAMTAARASAFVIGMIGNRKISPSIFLFRLLDLIEGSTGPLIVLARPFASSWLQPRWLHSRERRLLPGRWSAAGALFLCARALLFSRDVEIYGLLAKFDWWELIVTR